VDERVPAAALVSLTRREWIVLHALKRHSGGRTLDQTIEGLVCYSLQGFLDGAKCSSEDSAPTVFDKIERYLNAI
jgi:hypothetical protein